MNDGLKAILLIAVIILLVVIGPFLSIWAMNTLFPVLAIPYTFDTWCAVILIKGLLTVSVSKKD
jgi:hypothetical protein